MPKKKKKAAVEGEEPQTGKKKKKGKKKLLLVPVALIAVAAVAAAVIFLILPRFGIELLGGKDSDQLEEKIPKKGVEAYTVGEDTVASLDTILLEGEGELLAMRTTPEKSKEEEEGRLTYIYEVDHPAIVVDRYLDLVLGEEAGFRLADETYLLLEDRPELQDEEGGLMVAKNSVVEGRVFQLVIGWSQENDMLAVRVSAPEAQLHSPEKEKEEAQPASLSEQMDTIQTMHPSELGLEGRSMDQYVVLSTTGFVKVDDILCRRFTIYEKKGDGKRGDIVKVVYFSGDQQHMFQQETDENGKLIITELIT